MDRIRPSFEASHDFTSANRLMRLESRQSRQGTQLRSTELAEQQVGTPSNLPLAERWKRRLTRASERSVENK